MTIKEIRALSGLSQVKFGKKYDIPLNTIKNWECDPDKPNHRDCPIYVLKLLERAVKEDFDINNVHGEHHKTCQNSQQKL